MSTGTAPGTRTAGRDERIAVQWSDEGGTMGTAPVDAEAFRDELVQRVRSIAPQMRERAVTYDRQASFPHENFEDFRRLGLKPGDAASAEAWMEALLQARRDPPLRLRE